MIFHRVSQLRKLSGLSGYETARLSGVSAQHYYMIESGVRSRPRDATLGKLARLFGTTMAWIAYGEGTKPSEITVKRAVNAARKRHEIGKST